MTNTERIADLERRLSETVRERDTLRGVLAFYGTIIAALGDAKAQGEAKAVPVTSNARSFDRLRERMSAESRERSEAVALALRFHEAYERLAPQFGYETRPETRQFDAFSKNGKLMVAVCAELLGDTSPATGTAQPPHCSQCGLEYWQTDTGWRHPLEAGCIYSGAVFAQTPSDRPEGCTWPLRGDCLVCSKSGACPVDTRLERNY